MNHIYIICRKCVNSPKSTVSQGTEHHHTKDGPRAQHGQSAGGPGNHGTPTATTKVSMTHHHNQGQYEPPPQPRLV